jgi:hypothetical protein
MRLFFWLPHTVARALSLTWCVLEDDFDHHGLRVRCRQCGFSKRVL